MPDLIDKDKLKQAFRTNEGARVLQHSIVNLFQVDEVIDAQPTVDADDLISRSEAIAQLEGFKLSLGDIVLGFVVDRIIERIQALPAAEAGHG